MAFERPELIRPGIAIENISVNIGDIDQAPAAAHPVPGLARGVG